MTLPFQLIKFGSYSSLISPSLNSCCHLASHHLIYIPSAWTLCLFSSHARLRLNAVSARALWIVLLVFSIIILSGLCVIRDGSLLCHPPVCCRLFLPLSPMFGRYSMATSCSSQLRCHLCCSHSVFSWFLYCVYPHGEVGV
jgi:hypothetical protein